MRLHSEEWGEGPRVLFIHGLGASARYWHRLAAITTGYRGTAVDLLGFGRSPAGLSYTVDEHLDALAPYLQGRSFVVAHSAGTILAGALAARAPSAVTGLLLLGSPAFPSGEAARAEVGALGLLARLTVSRNPFARLLCGFMCAARPVAQHVAPLVQRDLPREVAEDALLHSWESYSQTLRHVVVGHRLVPDLTAAAVPTIMMSGDQDRAAPPRLLRQASDAQRRPTAVDVRVVPGDHHLALRRPAAVGDALGDLISWAER